MSLAFRLIALVALCTFSPAQAQEFCSDLTKLMSQVSQNQPTNQMTPLEGSESCKPVITLEDGLNYHCTWKFPYRDAAANREFETYIQDTVECLGNGTEIVQDQGVNHPDFYDQRQFRNEQGEVTISIKDKGALQNTFVFIAVRGTQSE